MNIKDEVKKINDYFVDKILKEEFIVDKHQTVNGNTYMLYIDIVGFKFTIWNCVNIGTVYNVDENFMCISFTEKQSAKLDTIIRRIYTEKFQKTQREIDRREYIKLKAKFEK